MAVSLPLDTALVTSRVRARRGAKNAARIVERTDGIPLFVEELTKSLLESGLLRQETGG